MKGCAVPLACSPFHCLTQQEREQDSRGHLPSLNDKPRAKHKASCHLWMISCRVPVGLPIPDMTLKVRGKTPEAQPPLYAPGPAAVPDLTSQKTQTGVPILSDTSSSAGLGAFRLAGQAAPQSSHCCRPGRSHYPKEEHV